MWEKMAKKVLKQYKQIRWRAKRAERSARFARRPFFFALSQLRRLVPG